MDDVDIVVVLELEVGLEEIDVGSTYIGGARVVKLAGLVLIFGQHIVCV